MTAYRWNANENVWEFYVAEWGGWNTLRVGTHVSTPPMTFADGFRYIVTNPLVRGREPETGWLRDMVNALPLGYVAAATPGAR